MESNVELKLSLIAVLVLAAVYIVYEAVTIPSGGHPFGHTLGIFGAILMVMTETLYSARKRLPFLNVGRTRHWLSFHIFTGIVGPALVLVHTGFAFRGFAGLAMFLTVLVVASGFLGRYIYTAVPRTLAGVEVDRRALQAELARQRQELLTWSAGRSQRLQALIEQETDMVLDSVDLSLQDILARRLQEWVGQRRLRRAIRRLEREEQARLADVERLLRRQRRLQRQLRSLAAARRLLGFWHMAHVPLGLTLFTAVAIHVIATIYYGALAGG